jgi:hypothetical protein
MAYNVLEAGASPKACMFCRQDIQMLPFLLLEQVKAILMGQSKNLISFIARNSHVRFRT